MGNGDWLKLNMCNDSNYKQNTVFFKIQNENNRTALMVHVNECQGNSHCYRVYLIACLHWFIIM